MTTPETNAGPSPELILAASAGWVAVVLNVVPGLGAGYLYQRRWKAYWITSVLATAWFVAGAALGLTAEPDAEPQTQLIGQKGEKGGSIDVRCTRVRLFYSDVFSLALWLDVCNGLPRASCFCSASPCP